MVLNTCLKRYEPGAKKRTYKHSYVLPNLCMRLYVLQNSYVGSYVRSFVLPDFHVCSYVRLYVIQNLYVRSYVLQNSYVLLYVLSNSYVHSYVLQQRCQPSFLVYFYIFCLFVLQLHHSILHHIHHPLWHRINFRRSHQRVLRTPLCLAGKQSTKVNLPLACRLFLLYPAHCTA